MKAFKSGEAAAEAALSRITMLTGRQRKAGVMTEETSAGVCAVEARQSTLAETGEWCEFYTRRSFRESQEDRTSGALRHGQSR